MNKAGRLLFFGVSVFVLFWVFALGSPDAPASKSVSPPPSSPKKDTLKITYEVTGEGTTGVSVTMQNNQGGTEQGDYELPFRKTNYFKVGDFAYLSAQNLRDRGSITCRIYVEGEEWKKSSSSGAYKIASCSGSVGGD